VAVVGAGDGLVEAFEPSSDSSLNNDAFPLLHGRFFFVCRLPGSFVLLPRALRPLAVLLTGSGMVAFPAALFLRRHHPSFTRLLTLTLAALQSVAAPPRR